MPFCIKKVENRGWHWLLWLLLWSAGQVCAAGIHIEKAEARLTNEGYVLSASFNMQLPAQVEDALHHHVTLYFVGELKLYRSRWYWPDTEIASYQQISKLSYDSLTRQYRISSGGLHQSFNTLQEALQVLGQLSSLPIDPAMLDNTEGGYFAQLTKKGSRINASATMRLDVSRLPKPLQINAIASDQWTLESPPFHWEIKPEKPAEAEAP